MQKKIQRVIPFLKNDVALPVFVKCGVGRHKLKVCATKERNIIRNGIIMLMRCISEVETRNDMLYFLVLASLESELLRFRCIHCTPESNNLSTGDNIVIISVSTSHVV